MDKILAAAKLNLVLDVLYRRPDGYHEVDMIMQTISLADELELEPNDRIELICDCPGLPVDQKNLVWKAVKLIQLEYGISKGIKITINKKIPVAAGLAGGSTDAAATLLGLNRLWNLNLTQTQLLQLGLRLGADVPFCILQGTARAEGVGEKLTPLKSGLSGNVLLVTPNIALATPEVYRRLKFGQITEHPRVLEAVTAIENGNLTQLRASWGNVLETAVMPYYPELRWLKGIFNQYGVEACLMSGSGPSIFGLNPTEEQIKLIISCLPPEWFYCKCELVPKVG
jgi:4-diphosphocytidyl-2-C-methyl-D-erythritol kinase